MARVLWLALPIALDVALVAIALRIRRRDRPRARLRRLALLYLLLLVVTSVGGVALGLRAAFSAAQSELVDPSQKARVLAEGISEAMNCAAFAALAFFVPMVVALALLWRAPKAS